MYLSPLNILYTNGVNQTEDLVTEADLEKKIKSYKENRQIPKLQVFCKDGHYFTLNNAELRVCRRLQNDGFCHRIRVERVPVKRIPKGILEMMIIPNPDVPFKRDAGQRSKNGYSKLTRGTITTDKEEVDTNNRADDNDSLSSYSIRSSDEEDSEDDKQDELDTDDWVSSSDESTESEIDEEVESFL